MATKNSTPTYQVKVGDVTFTLDSVDVGVNIRPGPAGQPIFQPNAKLLNTDGQPFAVPRAAQPTSDELDAISRAMNAALKVAIMADANVLAWLKREYNFTPQAPQS